MAGDKDPLAVRLRGLAVGVRTIAPHPELGGLFAAPTLVVAAPDPSVLRAWDVVAGLADLAAGRDVEGALAPLAKEFTVRQLFVVQQLPAIERALARRQEELDRHHIWLDVLAPALVLALDHARGTTAAELQLGRIVAATRAAIERDLFDGARLHGWRRESRVLVANGAVSLNELKPATALVEEQVELMASIEHMLQILTPAERRALLDPNDTSPAARKARSRARAKLRTTMSQKP